MDIFETVRMIKDELQEFIDKHGPALAPNHSVFHFALHPKVTVTGKRGRHYALGLRSRAVHDARMAVAHIDKGFEARQVGSHDEAMMYFFLAGQYAQRCDTWGCDLRNTLRLTGPIEHQNSRKGNRRSAHDFQQKDIDAMVAAAKLLRGEQSEKVPKRKKSQNEIAEELERDWTKHGFSKCFDSRSLNRHLKEHRDKWKV